MKIHKRSKNNKPCFDKYINSVILRNSVSKYNSDKGG